MKGVAIEVHLYVLRDPWHVVDHLLDVTQQPVDIYPINIVGSVTYEGILSEIELEIRRHLPLELEILLVMIRLMMLLVVVVMALMVSLPSAIMPS